MNTKETFKTKYKIENLSPLEAAIYTDKQSDINKRRVFIEIPKNFSDFLNFYRELIELEKRSYKNISITVLSFVNKVESEDVYEKDISILKTLKNIEIYNPADMEEAENILSYLSLIEFKGSKNDKGKDLSSKYVSYVRIDEDLKESVYTKHKKDFDGMPEIVYLSKKLNHHRDVAFISSGKDLSICISKAKELEVEMNAKVSVINLPMIHTSENSDESLLKNINNFFLNYTHHHKEFLFLKDDQNKNSPNILEIESFFRDILRTNKIENVKVSYI